MIFNTAMTVILDVRTSSNGTLFELYGSNIYKREDQEEYLDDLPVIKLMVYPTLEWD